MGGSGGIEYLVGEILKLFGSGVGLWLRIWLGVLMLFSRLFVVIMVEVSLLDWVVWCCVRVWLIWVMDCVIVWLLKDKVVIGVVCFWLNSVGLFCCCWWEGCCWFGWCCNGLLMDVEDDVMCDCLMVIFDILILVVGWCVSW